MPDPISIDIKPYMKSIPVSMPWENYVAVDLKGKEGAASSGNENVELMLVIDASYSMWEHNPETRKIHIDVVLDAIRSVVGELKSEGRVGIVAFDDSAHLISSISESANRDRNRQRMGIDRIKDLCGGGTTLLPALRKAMEDIRANSANPRAVRIVVLTDGQASDEQDVLDYVKSLEGQNIASMGFGKFHFAFMNQVCAPSKGLCVEVGSNSPDQIGEKLLEQLAIARDTVASNLRLRLTPRGRVLLQEAFVAHPHPTYLGAIERAQGQESWETQLAILEGTSGARIVLTLEHLPCDEGEFHYADLSLVYDLPGNGAKDQEITVPLKVNYSTNDMELQTVDKAVDEAASRCLDEKYRFLAEKAQKEGNTEAAAEYLQILEDTTGSKDVRVQANKTRIAVLAGDEEEAQKQMNQTTKATRTRQKE